MKNIIKQFLPIIKMLMGNENNVVLGGSQALKMHGLNMSRSLNDLDLIIYNPSERQQKCIEVYSFFDTIKDRPKENESSPRAIKLENKGYCLDIIKEYKEFPNNLLLYKYEDILFNVQNIQLVIDAKNSYKWEREGGDEVNLIKYRRTKDVEDLIDLKNSNFNLK